MKWKIASYMTLGCVLAFGAFNALRSDAQQPGSLPPGALPQEIPPRNVQQRGIEVRGPNYSTLPALSPLDSVGLPNGPRMVPHTRTIKNPDGTEVHVTEMRITEDIRMSSEDHRELRDSLSKLRATDASESDKKAARETIEKFLKDEFERDQKNRREHVERLEEQVSKLRKQLDKRQESQSKIIALRMQLLENDADGLSFPEGFNALQNMNGGIPFIGGYPPNTSYVSPPNIGGGISPPSPQYSPYTPYPQEYGPNQLIPRYDSSPKLPKKVEIQ